MEFVVALVALFGVSKVINKPEIQRVIEIEDKPDAFISSCIARANIFPYETYIACFVQGIYVKSTVFMDDYVAKLT